MKNDENQTDNNDKILHLLVNGMSVHHLVAILYTTLDKLIMSNFLTKTSLLCKSQLKRSLRYRTSKWQWVCCDVTYKLFILFLEMQIVYSA